jgi:hypothetical protein
MIIKKKKNKKQRKNRIRIRTWNVKPKREQNWRDWSCCLVTSWAAFFSTRKGNMGCKLRRTAQEPCKINLNRNL